ncbi:MAG: N-acetylneuraminate synthase [Candidatus Latescibacteria bacterium]|jgi:N,N'-diacetyllegionaminate synthase|nr:N-acetylneuraminate synthase [Candidatus Latescibacterota bacterium]
MIRIGDHPVGDTHPCFITFEIGPTHEGVESAKRLIQHASTAGADAVKFQILDPDRLVSDKTQMFSYSVLVDRDSGSTEIVDEPLYDILKRRHLADYEWRELKAFSDSLGMAFFSTVAFDDEIELLEDLGCHSIKIASADINHLPLIRRAAQTGMCIQLDTGMATLGEIETAVNVISSEGNQDIIIHQCPSGYPALLDSINLRIIPTLRQLFPYPVAFSDHSPGILMDVAALALGANLLEKTITENRMTPSVEHIMSLEPDEMHSFVRTIRDTETALGATRRVLTPDESSARLAARRSTFLTAEAKAGQSLNECTVEFRRPGYGLPPDIFVTLQDATINRDLNDGHMLRLRDLRWTQEL